MSLLDILSDTIKSEDEIEGRIYGFVYGKVTNTADPNQLGRVKARILAQDDKEESDWLLPLWPGAMEGIPDVGEMLVVAFVNGDPHRGVYAGHPITTTKNRATEAMVLGHSLATFINTFVDIYNNHIHPAPGTAAPIAAYQMTKVTDGNGSVVSSMTGVPAAPPTRNQSVLSRRAKIK